MKSEVLLKLKTLFILFKLMNNHVLGKTLENIRNHSFVKIINKSWKSAGTIRRNEGIYLSKRMTVKLF